MLGVSDHMRTGTFKFISCCALILSMPDSSVVSGTICTSLLSGIFGGKIVNSVLTFVLELDIILQNVPWRSWYGDVVPKNCFLMPAEFSSHNVSAVAVWNYESSKPRNRLHRLKD